DLGRDVVSLGMIKDLQISDAGRVSFTFELTTPACPVRDRFQDQARQYVAGLPGVTEVDFKMTANVRPAFVRSQPNQMLPGVKQTIAVASGKGGVGKSTVAANLAASLGLSGARVGLPAADFYDASLTIAQSVPLTGVVIVATPQDVALDIAVKALQMFRSLNVTALGLVENMSYFVCPDCGREHHIFSHGGAEIAARKLGVPYLGAIPLEVAIREDSDRGTPIVVSRPDSAGARAFREMASQIAARTSIQSFRQLP